MLDTDPQTPPAELTPAQARELTKKHSAAAFLTFVETGDIEATAEVHGLDPAQLKQTAKREKWEPKRELARTRGSLAVTRPMSGDDTSELARAELVRRNREASYRVAERLRDDLESVIDDLRAGALEVEETKLVSGVPVVYKRRASLADRVVLANYATQIANLGYQALGDSPKTAGADAASAGGKSGPASAPQIQIVLPISIARPRDEQAEGAPEGAGGAIDV